MPQSESSTLNSSNMALTLQSGSFEKCVPQPRQSEKEDCLALGAPTCEGEERTISTPGGQGMPCFDEVVFCTDYYRNFSFSRAADIMMSEVLYA